MERPWRRDIETVREPVVALMQPTFLPWAGYFALIDAVDLFVFLDDFQFQRHYWDHRNRLFLDSKGGVDWVIVPVKHAGGPARFDEIHPLVEGRFAKKFLRTLQHSYARAPHYLELMPHIEQWMKGRWLTLAEFNISFIRLACRLMGIHTETRLSSEIGSNGQRSARVADLLRRTGAGTYLSPRGAADYMIEEGVFPLEDIDTYFQQHEPAEYPQVQSPEFVSHLSVLDMLLQIGPDDALATIRDSEGPATSWAKMAVSAAVEKDMSSQ